MKELKTFFPIRRWKSLDSKKTDWELLGLQSQVAYIREERVSFIDSECVSQETYFNSEGFIKMQIYNDEYKVKFDYDEDNRPLNVEVFNLLELQKKLVFHYDVLKNELQIQCLSASNNVVKHTAFIYNTVGLLIEENHITKNEKITIKYAYDKWNRLITQEEYYADNLECFQNYLHYSNNHFIRQNYNWKHELSSVEVHQIQESQESKTVVIYNRQKNIIAHFNFEYDNIGNLVKKERVNDSINKATVTHHYEFDTKNNWIQKNTISKAEITEITKRAFEY